MSQVRESLLRSRAYEHYLDKHPGPHTTYTLARTSWKAGKLTPDVAGPYPGGHGHCVRYSHAVAAGGIGGRESSRRLQQRHAAPSAGWSASPAPLLPSARGAWACPCPPPLPRPFRAWVVRPPRSPPSPSRVCMCEVPSPFDSRNSSPPTVFFFPFPHSQVPLTRDEAVPEERFATAPAHSRSHAGILVFAFGCTCGHPPRTPACERVRDVCDPLSKLLHAHHSESRCVRIPRWR